MRLNQIGFLGLVVLSLSLYHCKQKGGDFKTTPSGIKYKIFSANKNKKLKAGDFFDFHMVILNSKDSVIQDSYKNPDGAIKNQQFPADSTKGGLIEAFLLLSEGDSAIFRISNDSLIAQRNRSIQKSLDMMKAQKEVQVAQAPNDSTRKLIEQRYKNQIQLGEAQMKQEDPNLPKGGYVEYRVKLLAIKTREDVEKEMQEANKKRIEEAEKRLGGEKKQIEQYLKDKKLNGKSTTSGLFYVIQKEGTGASPQPGDSVSVNYKGMLLNGKVFDTSIEAEAKAAEVFNPNRTYGPFKFILGRQQVIPGWDEGIALLKLGTKALLLIPSRLAYAERGTPDGSIPPHSILIFEVELIGFKSGQDSKTTGKW
ncbi:MAG: hypothetical protein OHK0053_06900 [Microscillaceae bacterium]